MRRYTRQLTQLAIVASFPLALAGMLIGGMAIFAAQEKTPADDAKPDAAKSAPSKAADISPATFKVPDKATPKELLRFIHKIDALRPEFETVPEAEKFLTTSRNAIIAAADKLLQSKPESEQAVEALKSKLEAYQVLVVVGGPDAMANALKFADGLRHDKRPILAEMGQDAWLNLKLPTIPSSTPQERRAFVEDLATWLREKPQTYFELARQLGQMLEAMGDGKTAVFAYETFGNILSKNLDERIHSIGESMKTAWVRRARLLEGEPLKITGTTVDGKPFDLSQYKGKVIVVDFWATWCGPCLAELPNLKAVYEKYHGRGLEVVGISLDDDKVELTKFLKENDLPWKVLLNADEKKRGFKDPIAEGYGIFGIPTVFLVNQEGKVVSLAARGERLVAQVGKLLGGSSDAASEKAGTGDAKEK